jgi:hypothetical protein
MVPIIIQIHVLIELISVADRAKVDPKTAMQLDQGATTMTRLNPLTTPRHELRAEKARRNKEAALTAFTARKAEIDGMLARLQALSDDHFNAHPDEVNWGHVGTLEHYASLLKRITDSAFKEGEYAN